MIILINFIQMIGQKYEIQKVQLEYLLLVLAKKTSKLFMLNHIVLDINIILLQIMPVDYNMLN